jgi:transmembrane sensor
MDKYALYQTEDFLRDESFINWVLDPEGKSAGEWDEWLIANPVKKEAAQKAIDIIRSFDFKKEPVGESFYIDLKKRIDQTIVTQPVKLKTATAFPVWLKAAAVVAGLLLSALALFYYVKPSWNTISTPYAAIKTVWLPDSSEVVLNANSTIRYRGNWNNNEREVWITGEAFFKVRHIDKAGEAQHFTVHAEGDAAIEVLGTEFNVKSINNITGVMLREGKVRFSVPASHPQTIMKPNDYCVYNATPGKITTSVADPVLYTSWMEHRYRFEKTPAREVCETLKEYFGYDFIIRKPDLAEQSVSGTLELQNEQVMFKVLSELLNAAVTKNGNNVVIE